MDPVVGEAFLRQLPSRGAHPRAQRRIQQQLFQRVRQGGGVARGNEQPVLAGADDGGAATIRGMRMRRQTPCPGAVRTSNVPPMAAARSRIIARPK